MNTLLGLISALFVSAMILPIAWVCDFFRLPHPIPQEKVQTKDLLTCLLCFLAVLTVIIPLLLTGVLSFKYGHLVNLAQVELTPQEETLFDILNMATTGVAVWIYYLLCPRSVRDAIMRSKGHHKVGVNLLMGIVTWVVSYPIVLSFSLMVQWVSQFFADYPHEEQLAVSALKSTLGDSFSFNVMAFLIALVIPVVEELIFRGFIQTWLLNWFKRGGAIVLTSLIFALCHYSSSQGFENIGLLLSLFVFSCFLGFIYERQSSLWAPIALHATFNIMSIVAILM